MQKIIDDFLAAVAVATTQAEIDAAVAVAIRAVARICSASIIAAGFANTPLPPSARRGIREAFLNQGVLVDPEPSDGLIRR